MKMKNFSQTLLIMTMVFSSQLQVQGSTLAIDEATGSDSSSSGSDRTLGWIFDVTQDIIVQELGIWDDGEDGLLASHEVGIWTSGGTLLGSSTVQLGTGSPTKGPLVSGGRFRFESVSPIALDAGQTYVIGGQFWNNDDFVFDASSVSTASEITFIDERFGFTGAGFVFPTSTANRIGLFGPNFTFVVVPEPCTLCLAGLGIVALGFSRRRPFIITY